MENSTQISLSAITHVGTACAGNDNRIYANGRFANPFNADCSQISLDSSGRQFLFALSDGMDAGASGISVMEDLKKLHEKIKSSSKDVQVKLDELSECVEQTNNLLFSMTLGDSEEKPKPPAFAGIIIDNGGIAAVNLGSSRIYKLDGDNLKLMVNDYKRTERLLKMGIINNEQAELLSGQFKAVSSDGKPSVKKSDVYMVKEGTVYLICSRGLTDSVNEDVIYDILASGTETDVIADLLVKEALKNEAEDNVSVMVLKVLGTGGEAVLGSNVRTIPSRNIHGRINRLSRNAKKKNIDVGKLVTTVLIFVVAAAFLFGALTLYLNTSGLRAKNTSANNDSPSSTAVSSTSEGVATPGEGTPGDGTDGSLSSDGTDSSLTTNGNSGDNTAGGDSGNAAVGEQTYTVKAGDSLMKISKQVYNDESKYKLIMDANGITDPNKIQIGQVLKIPAGD